MSSDRPFVANANYGNILAVLSGLLLAVPRRRWSFWVLLLSFCVTMKMLHVIMLHLYGGLLNASVTSWSLRPLATISSCDHLLVHARQTGRLVLVGNIVWTMVFAFHRKSISPIAAVADSGSAMDTRRLITKPHQASVSFTSVRCSCGRKHWSQLRPPVSLG